MEYKRKFKTVRELLNSEEFKSKDLSYCDLSYLDLRSLSWATWRDFKFYHTNFRSTGIVFEPISLAKDENGNHIMEYCDFTNCDLSHIVYMYPVSIKGSNFTNTHLRANPFINNSRELEDVIFSEEMVPNIIRYLQEHRIGESLTIKNIQQNAHIKFSSADIISVISNQLPPKNTFLSSRHVAQYNGLMVASLGEDAKREGSIFRLYKALSSGGFTDIDKIQFFQCYVHDKHYDKLDLSSISPSLLDKFTFTNCTFEELILPNGDMARLDIHNEDVKQERITTIPHIIIKDFDVSSWQRKMPKRLGSTCFTCQTNLYLELGRSCNAKCPFCRNQELSKCRLNVERLLESYRQIEPTLHNVVVGGGEPTLPKTRKLLERIWDERRNYNLKHFVSTNGTCGKKYLKELIDKRNYHINLSRHAVEDADNDRIFGVHTLTTEEIRAFIDENIYTKQYLTLVATCFNGGLNSAQELERYIELSEYVHVRSLLFQSLHEDLGEKDRLAQIDDLVFDEVIAHLREQGYFVSELPIYSTGDYKLIIVKSPNNSKTISFKKYISQEELEREWPRAPKRTFDLSLTPNGDVYQNWHQQSDKVLINLPKK